MARGSWHVLRCHTLKDEPVPVPFSYVDLFSFLTNRNLEIQLEDMEEGCEFPQPQRGLGKALADTKFGAF